MYNDTIFQFGPKGLFKKIVSVESVVFEYKELNYVQVDKEIATRQFPRTPDIIDVQNTDTLTMLRQYKDQGLNPLVLNMASNFKPGGGVTSGSSAQEENLFRRSNYFKTLDFDMLPRKTYPLAPDNAIYSPNVCVIKDTDYELLEEPYYGDFLACAAVRNPKLTRDGKYKFSQDYDSMGMKIDMIYKAAVHYNHDSLILGALGCGAFHNPPEQVAEMFKIQNEAYMTDELSCFKKIGFPIFSEPGNPNYDIFKRVLTT